MKERVKSLVSAGFTSASLALGAMSLWAIHKAVRWATPARAEAIFVAYHTSWIQLSSNSLRPVYAAMAERPITTVTPDGVEVTDWTNTPSAKERLKTATSSVMTREQWNRTH